MAKKPGRPATVSGRSQGARDVQPGGGRLKLTDASEYGNSAIERWASDGSAGWLGRVDLIEHTHRDPHIDMCGQRSRPHERVATAGGIRRSHLRNRRVRRSAKSHRLRRDNQLTITRNTNMYSEHAERSAWARAADASKLTEREFRRAFADAFPDADDYDFNKAVGLNVVRPDEFIVMADDDHRDESLLRRMAWAMRHACLISTESIEAFLAGFPGATIAHFRVAKALYDLRLAGEPGDEQLKLNELVKLKPAWFDRIYAEMEAGEPTGLLLRVEVMPDGHLHWIRFTRLFPNGRRFSYLVDSHDLMILITTLRGAMAEVTAIMNDMREAQAGAIARDWEPNPDDGNDPRISLFEAAIAPQG